MTHGLFNDADPSALLNNAESFGWVSQEEAQQLRAAFPPRGAGQWASDAARALRGFIVSVCTERRDRLSESERDAPFITHTLREQARTERNRKLVAWLTETITAPNTRPPATAAEIRALHSVGIGYTYSATDVVHAPAEPKVRQAVLEAVWRVRRADVPLGSLPRSATAASSPATWTAGQINKALDKLEAESSAITGEFITSGRGRERPSDWQDKTDPLSRRAQRNADAIGTLHAEIERRMGPGATHRLPKGFGPLKGTR